MPNELQSYALTVLTAILSAKQLTPDVPADQRAKQNKHQADLVSELTLFLLEHYAASGYDTDVIGLTLRQQIVLYVKNH